jgi:hypothetical protein
MKRTLNHKSLYHNAFGAWGPFFRMKPPEHEIAVYAFRRGKEVLKAHLYKCVCMKKWVRNVRQGLLGGIGALAGEKKSWEASLGTSLKRAG